MTIEQELESHGIDGTLDRALKAAFGRWRHREANGFEEIGELTDGKENSMDIDPTGEDASEAPTTTDSPERRVLATGHAPTDPHDYRYKGLAGTHPFDRRAHDSFGGG